MMGSSLECRENWVLFSSMLLKLECCRVDWVLLSCSCYSGHEDCCYKVAALSNRYCFGETFVERCKADDVVGGNAGVEGQT